MATVANSAGEKPCPMKKTKEPTCSDRSSVEGLRAKSDTERYRTAQSGATWQKESDYRYS
jgi:hypothetical protein